jgi:hypothetical protein
MVRWSACLSKSRNENHCLRGPRVLAARFFFSLMNTAGNFTKKVFKDATLSQIVFRVEVLEHYLTQKGAAVTRTETVGRVKAASWSLDFGIAPDEKTIHATLRDLQNKLPENESEHWLSHVEDKGFSENFLKMQGSHACIDDGGLRNWGEESLF